MNFLRKLLIPLSNWRLKKSLAKFKPNHILLIENFKNDQTLFRDSIWQIKKVVWRGWWLPVEIMCSQFNCVGQSFFCLSDIKKYTIFNNVNPRFKEGATALDVKGEKYNIESIRLHIHRNYFTYNLIDLHVMYGCRSLENKYKWRNILENELDPWVDAAKIWRDLMDISNEPK